MGCNCKNGVLFNTEFDHTFDSHNNRCQDAEINEVEELKKFVEDVTKDALGDIVEKKIQESIKSIQNQLNIINESIRNLEGADVEINNKLNNIIDVTIPGLVTDITNLQIKYSKLETSVTNILNQIEQGTIGGVNVIKSPTEPQDKTKGTIWIKTS